ncbi:MAG TPA: glycosyltransferase, partial [Thermoanaerobaculia bacterium]|nr:glycosyltransferase [Thermoanaerobaculia bacterium]
QDFQDLEILISDNASTDATPALIAEYEAMDKRVRHVRLPSTVHPINNFENALKHARGEMFSWLAHDDFYENSDHVSRLAAKIAEGNAFVFPGVYMAHMQRDGSVIREERDALAAFAGISTKWQIVRQAIRHSSIQIYGMYRTSKLREYFPLLLEDQDMICFFENRFIQKFLVDEPWAYVPDAHLNLGQSSENYTRNQDSRRLLHDFVVYTRRLSAMYRRSPRFSSFERLRVDAHIGRVHVPYMGRLFASALKQKMVGKRS